MLTRVFSAALQGVDGLEVEIEVNTGPGEPKIIVVGLPDAAVRERKKGSEKRGQFSPVDIAAF